MTLDEFDALSNDEQIAVVKARIDAAMKLQDDLFLEDLRRAMYGLPERQPIEQQS